MFETSKCHGTSSIVGAYRIKSDYFVPVHAHGPTEREGEWGWGPTEGHHGKSYTRGHDKEGQYSWIRDIG